MLEPTAALALAGALIAAPVSPEAGAKVTLVKAGRLLDARTGAYLPGQAVLVEGERIKEVGPLSAVGPHAPKDAEVVDLGRATLLPGLVDCHAHLLSSMKLRLFVSENLLTTVAGMSASARALQGAANAREALEAGITSVRNVGHSGVDGDAALRDAIDGGLVPGPRMLAATRKLTPPGGQGLAPRHELAREVKHLEYLPVGSADEGRRAVREALFAGADVIKVVMDPEPRMLGYDETKAIVEEAHRSKVKVAAHAISAEGVKTAVDAGVDSVEHGNGASDESLRAMHDKGIFLVATDWSADLIREIFIKSRVYSPEELAGAEAEISSWVDGATKRMQRARKAGVKIAMGSDMWFAYPGKTRGQATLLTLEGLQAEGVPPAEILRAATVDAAELLGWQDKLGSLEAGKLADMIALEGDPLKDVRDLQRVSFVMKGGVVVRRAR